MRQVLYLVNLSHPWATVLYAGCAKGGPVMKHRTTAGLIAATALLGSIATVVSASAAPVGEFTTSNQIDGSSTPLGIAKSADGSM